MRKYALHLLLSVLQFLPGIIQGQTRPDNFPVETNPTNSNFEFYTQKGGSARRATMDAIANYIAPRIEAAPIAYTPTATGNPYADYRKFVIDPGGDIYYIDADGDGMLIYTSSSVGVTDGDKGDIDVTSTGTVWTVDTSAITTVKIAANAVDSTKICAGCVSVLDLGQHGATSGQFLGWNGTQWTPRTITASLTDTTITNHLLPSGTSNWTLRHSGSAWVADSMLRNDGSQLGIGISPSSSYKLTVKQSGASNSTNGISIVRSSSTASLNLYHNGAATVESQGGLNLTLKTGSGSIISLIPGGGAGQIRQVAITPTASITSVESNASMLGVTGTFAPTAAGGDFSMINADMAINQTSSANGITRGLNVNPTLTAVLNEFRGVAYQPSTQVFLYQPNGTSVRNHLIGNLGIGTGTTTPAGKLQIVGNGATSSTYPLIVTNSGATTSTAALCVRDDSRVGIGTNAPTSALSVSGNVELMAAGNKLKIASGSNASMGTATLVGGTVTVSTTAIATGSTIFLTCNTPGGTQGFLSAPAASIVNATSFVINSSSGSDTSTVNWLIIN